jgi:ABC-type transporter Mla subunit MlaD
VRRRPRSSIAANPVLVGAVTVLVVTVAVFLSYNANKGLPFVPTTELRFLATNGANLLPGNEVREGGTRIGVVDRMDPARLPDGTVGARVVVKLDKAAGEIPVDSTIDVRPRSPLGLKYVELTRGESEQTYRDGGVLPDDQVVFPTELDEFYGMFDAKTREGVRRTTTGVGNTFTARGESINRALDGAPRLLRRLEPVARTLADPDTELRRLFRELGDFARVVRPVSDRYANSFSAGADTLEAWSRDEAKLRESIRESPPTLDAGVENFPRQRPFLAALEGFSREVRRTTEIIPTSVPAIAKALDTGSPVLRRTPEVNTRLQDTLKAVDELARDPASGIALRGLGRTTGEVLNPFLKFIGPYITVCNYWNTTWTHLGEHVTEPDPTGYGQRTLLNNAPRPRNPSDPSLGSIGARRPVNGEEVVSGAKAYFHTNYYGAAITEDGRADCEPGQRGYLRRLDTFSTDPTLEVVRDPRTPGVQGTTFSGRPRVPEGQTFSRNPLLGPPFPRELDHR